MSQGPYHLIPIAFLLTITYLASHVAARKELLDRHSHRRFWNVLLLLFFFSTAILGLILVIKVNYKLDMPWLEEAMQWHVDMGIGFAFVAAFHLSWHLPYYLKGRKVPKSVTNGPAWTPHLSISGSLQRSFFLLLGYLSVFAQLVLLREFLKTLHGNELILGLFLALWMSMGAAGASMGAGSRAKLTFSTLLRLLLVLSILPLLTYLLLIAATRFILLPGMAPGMLDSLILMVLLTGPFSLISGFLFAYVSKSIQIRRSKDVFYRLDSLGSLLGGLLFGALLVFFLDNLQALVWLVFSTALVLALVFRYPSGRYGRPILLLSATLLYVLVLLPGPHMMLEGLRYRGESLVESRDTPFGNLALTAKDGQYNLYMDRNPVLVSDELAEAEAHIHFAALQHPAPGSFLLMGGGVAGTVREVVKYLPGRIDYCETDPWVYRLQSSFLTDPLPESLRFIPMDGRKWLMKADSLHYDVIISSASDPSTLGWNRFFTLEFFTFVRERLERDGIFAMKLAVGGNYLDRQGKDLLGITHHTLSQVFEHVQLIPGEHIWILASDRELSLDYPALLDHHGIRTSFVHPDYLDPMRMEFDAAQLLEGIGEETRTINMDLRPALFFSRIRGLESIHGRHALMVTGILGFLIFLVLLIYYPPLKAGMFVSGFTGAGIQILLILVMQSFYGYAYLLTPIMITLFMAGIVTGSLLWRRLWSAATKMRYMALLAIMALLAALLAWLVAKDTLFSAQASGQVLLGLCNFIPGTIVGSVYGMSLMLHRKSESKSPMGLLFSADLAGAALGSIVPVIFLLPLTGMQNTFILLAALNLGTATYLLARNG